MGRDGHSTSRNEQISSTCCGTFLQARQLQPESVQISIVVISNLDNTDCGYVIVVKKTYPELSPELRPELRPELSPELSAELSPDLSLDLSPKLHIYLYAV